MPYVGLQLVEGLRRRGVAVDCYMTGDGEEFPDVLREDDGVRLYRSPTHWEWHRWYSRDPMSAFITGQAAKGVAQRRLAEMMAEQHARQPYDVLYRYSQIELFGYGTDWTPYRRSSSIPRFTLRRSSGGTVASASWRHVARVPSGG